MAVMRDTECKFHAGVSVIVLIVVQTAILRRSAAADQRAEGN